MNPESEDLSQKFHSSKTMGKAQCRRLSLIFMSTARALMCYV